MRKIALITCCTRDEKSVDDRGFIKRIYEKLKGFFVSLNREKLFKDSIEKLEPSDEVEINIITLPYTLQELQTLSKRRLKQINKFLAGVGSKTGSELLILPESIARIQSFDHCIINPFKGDYLYKCLLIQIINEIFYRRDIKTWEIDIAIIQGTHRKSLYNLIELLSPMVRFLTIISEEKEEIEEEANEAFLDSGLAIAITSDWKGVLKQADLIINLDEEKGYIKKAKTKEEALLINLGRLEAVDIICESIVVDGVDIDIPAGLKRIFDKSLFSYFQYVEIAEMLILYSVGTGTEANRNSFPEPHTVKQIIKEFKKWNFSIRGFMGRRGKFKIEDIAG